MRAATADLKRERNRPSALVRVSLAIARAFGRWVRNAYGPDAIDRQAARRWYWGL